MALDLVKPGPDSRSTWSPGIPHSGAEPKHLHFFLSFIFFVLILGCTRSWPFQVVKNLPAYAGITRGVGLIPGLGRSTAGGHGNPLQYSCLENPTERGA